jgi:mannosyl-3-phosphoglycerate phosphatase
MPRLTAAWWLKSNGFAWRLWPGYQRGAIESPSAAKRVVLFTDPDTLRERGDRDWTALREVVSALDHEGITVVLWGNETRSEMERIQSDLNLQHPFITESGGGLFVRHGYFDTRLAHGRRVQNYDVVEFGQPYDHVAEVLHEVARRTEVTIIGFSDMSIAEVAHDCDLSLAQARLAKLREYDEPFRMVGAGEEQYRRVCSGLFRAGLRCFTHDAFHHATGVADGKQSIRVLETLYRHTCDGHVLTVGLGKHGSETSLLRGVDIPIIVQDDLDTVHLGGTARTARFLSADGPGGWCDAILQFIDRRSPG